MLEKNAKSFYDLANSRFETLAKQAEGDLGKRQEGIAALLAPLREQLDTYQKRLAEIEGERKKDNTDVNNLLATLRDSHQKLDTQTGQLVTALSNPGTRGRWGEIALERILQLAGLTKGIHYEPQSTVAGEDGANQRPDMLVKLPDNRQIILDSKVPWDAFRDAVAESDDKRRAEGFRAYAAAVRGHVTALSRRAYQQSVEGTLEFVVMFLPGEAFLYAAVEHSPSIIQDAMEKKVVLATPTTLIALLKAVEFGWRQHHAAENAAEIQELGQQLHQRIGRFIELFAKVGAGLDAAAKSYNAAASSLDRYLLTTTQRFEDRHVRSEKQIAAVEQIDTRVEDVGDKALAAVGRAGENHHGVTEGTEAGSGT